MQSLNSKAVMWLHFLSREVVCPVIAVAIWIMTSHDSWTILVVHQDHWKYPDFLSFTLWICVQLATAEIKIVDTINTNGLIY